MLSYVSSLCICILFRCIKQTKPFKKCAQLYVNGKLIAIETIPGIKESSGVGEPKYDIFDTFLRTFANATM
jgi:hypothetical protein